MSGEALNSLMLSLKVAAVATVFVSAIGIAAAYFLARRSFRGKEVLDSLLTLPLVLPPTVTGYYLVLLLGRRGFLGGPLYESLGLSLMFTWQGAAVAAFVVSLPLMIKITRSAIESVDENLISVSSTLGHSELRTALKVILPLSLKGIAAGAALSFARALGEFGATLMIAGNIPGKTDTMPLAIYTKASSGDWAGANAMVAVFTLMSFGFLLAANRFFKRATA